MVKRHLARLSTPRTWPVERKVDVWIVRPNCGAHKMKNCLPIAVVLREILKHASTSREVKQILNDKNVIINGKVKKDPKTQIGFMDVLELPKIKKKYRMIFDKKGKLVLKEANAQESEIVIANIIGKKTIKNKKTQLNLNDGTNLLADKSQYKLGDSLVLTIPDRKVKMHLKLEKGATVYLTGGNKVGQTGKVEEILNVKGMQKSTIKIKSNDETFETRKEYAFVIGKEKPLINTE